MKKSFTAFSFSEGIKQINSFQWRGVSVHQITHTSHTYLTCKKYKNVKICMFTMQIQEFSPPAFFVSIDDRHPSTLILLLWYSCIVFLCVYVCSSHHKKKIKKLEYLLLHEISFACIIK